MILFISIQPKACVRASLKNCFQEQPLFFTDVILKSTAMKNFLTYSLPFKDPSFSLRMTK